MVQLLVRLTAAPGRVEDTLQALTRVRVGAQLDPESLRTHLGIDADEPDTLVYIEEWSDHNRLAHRIQSASFRSLLGLLETSIAAPVLEVRDVASIGGLDYVARVRRALEGGTG